MPTKLACFINANSGEPIYQQLTRQLKHAISTGALKPGDRLPTVRELAEQLVINPNTVARSYRELFAEGLVQGTQGSGTYVNDPLPRLKSRERQERILPLIQQVVGEAALLGIRGPQLLKLIEQAIHDYEENSHDHNSRTFEELR